MKCVHCGHDLKDEAKFCTRCGKPVQRIQGESPIFYDGGGVKSTPSRSNTKTVVICIVVAVIGIVTLAAATGLVLRLKKMQDKVTVYNDEITTELGSTAASTDGSTAVSTQASTATSTENVVQYNTTINNTIYEPAYEEPANNNTSYAYETEEFILPKSNERILQKSDLYGLTKWQCKIARNEIYARHGRLFKDDELQNYFTSCSWYKGRIDPDDFSESVLNEVELANRDLIVNYEKEMGYR